ncbi:E3 ubiquitin-protein ligase TRIM45-like [Haliotis asinina]|uniref:E3 ubiquitin-protein ligase TRIM45-like n=1 Tax=Haliotis asinina TaxID=109174 RepID=UPI0035322594
MMASPAPSDCGTFTTSSSSDYEMDSANHGTRCDLCSSSVFLPRMVSCHHTLCQPCMERALHETGAAHCPLCPLDIYLGGHDVSELNQRTRRDVFSDWFGESDVVQCTACKVKDATASAICFDCGHFLCGNCVMAHRFMNRFKGHRVMSLEHLQLNTDKGPMPDKPDICPQHSNKVLDHFCTTCSKPVCSDCILEHNEGHVCKPLTDVADDHIDSLRHLLANAKHKIDHLRALTKRAAHNSSALLSQHRASSSGINDTFSFFSSMLDRRRTEAMIELHETFNSKQVAISTLAQQIQNTTHTLNQGVQYIDKVLQHSSVTATLLIKKHLEEHFQNLFSYLPSLQNGQLSEINFVSDYQTIQAELRANFGFVRHGCEMLQMTTQKFQSAGRVNNIY